MKRLHAVVSGQVQGVSFRYYAEQTARELELTGWVQNRMDGTVEVMAEGEKAQLTTLLQFLKDGPPLAEVENVETTWGEATGEFEQFEVSYGR